MKVFFYDNNTHIENSFELTGESLKIALKRIMEERNKKGHPITRTFESYVNEWKGHNRLYKLHLFRKHTKDVDLEEPQRLFWRIVWGIIGR